MLAFHITPPPASSHIVTDSAQQAIQSIVRFKLQPSDFGHCSLGSTKVYVTMSTNTSSSPLRDRRQLKQLSNVIFSKMRDQFWIKGGISLFLSHSHYSQSNFVHCVLLYWIFGKGRGNLPDHPGERAMKHIETCLLTSRFFMCGTGSQGLYEHLLIHHSGSG